MITVIDLPVEIVETIAGHLELVSLTHTPSLTSHCLPGELQPSRWKDLANFRATCKYADGILTPRVLSTIIFDLSDWRSARGLIRMASRPNRMHLFARKLKIRCLAPGANANGFPPHIVMERDGSFGYPERPSDKDVLQAAQIISQYLPGAFRHFHNLEVVEYVQSHNSLGCISHDGDRWRTHAFDVGDTNRAVVDLLRSQDNLRNVSIDMSCDVSFPYPQLGHLSNLSQLSITFPRIHMQAGPLFSGTAQALRNSPDLIDLQIKLQPHYHRPDLVYLDEIYRQMASLRNVRNLSLGIPTALSLSKFSSLDNLSNLISLDIRPEYSLQGLNEMWRALDKCRIHLKSISLNILDLEDGFLDYLSTYSGVEELLLSNTEEYWAEPTPNDTALATRFFETIVEKHATSLKVLEMCSYSSSATWGDVSERPKRLAKLRALERLKIELGNDEIATITTASSDDYVRSKNFSCCRKWK